MISLNKEKKEREKKECVTSDFRLKVAEIQSLKKYIYEQTIVHSNNEVSCYEADS